MQELCDWGLLEAVEPASYLGDIDGFSEGFLSILDARSRPKVADTNAPEGAPRPVAQDGPGEDTPRRQLVRRSKAPRARLPRNLTDDPRPDSPPVPGGAVSIPVAADFPLPRLGLSSMAAIPDRDGPGPGRDASQRSLLHRDKAAPDIWAELIARGYAYEKRRGDEWLAVDRWVADLYMAYLALTLGRLLDAEPVTDDESALAAIVDVGPASLVPSAEHARSIILSNVLPAPAQPVAPREIARFKEKNWDALLRFRLHAEMRITECLRPSDPELQDRCLSLAAQQLELEVAEVEALMTRRRWPTTRGLLCAALAGAPGAAKTAITGNPLDATEVASPLIAEIVDSFLGNRSDATRNPVAYAALATRAFTLPRQRRA